MIITLIIIDRIVNKANPKIRHVVVKLVRENNERSECCSSLKLICEFVIEPLVLWEISSRSLIFVIEWEFSCKFVSERWSWYDCSKTILWLFILDNSIWRKIYLYRNYQILFEKLYKKKRFFVVIDDKQSNYCIKYICTH
jgi:hypothetical protein